MEYDPEKALWKPSRRSFFFGLGAALIAPMLPSVPRGLIPGTGNTLITADLVMKEMAIGYRNSLKFAAIGYRNSLKFAGNISRLYSDEFWVGDTVKVRLPVRFMSEVQ